MHYKYTYIYNISIFILSYSYFSLFRILLKSDIEMIEISDREMY